MSRNLKSAIAVFIVVAVGSFVARKYGFYNSLWYTDVILHTLSGIGFGCLMLYIFGNDRIKPLVRIVSIVGFAVMGSFFWELWEFSGWHLIPGNMEFYQPNLGDSLGDIASGMLGGFLVALTSLWHVRSRK